MVSAEMGLLSRLLLCTFLVYTFGADRVMSAVTSVTFSVHKGTVPNLAGTVGVTVRNGSEIEMRCTYDAVPTTGEIGAHDFFLNAEVQPSTFFFRYINHARPGRLNPEIRAPFLNPLRLVQQDGSNFGGIRVNPILLTDENTYKCQVVLAIFTSLSAPIVKVNVVAIPHVPTLSMAPGPLVAGMKLTVTCAANVGKPKGQLKWLRQLRAESSPVVIQRSNTVSQVQNSDGSFDVTETYIVDILPGTYDGAIFTCESRNDALVSLENSPKSELTLDVKYAVRDIKVTPIEQPHYPGHQFKCEAVGNPAPAYQWTKVNGTQSFSIYGNLLTIPDTATPESLFYKCVAFNTPGSSEIQISYTLHVNITAAKICQCQCQCQCKFQRANTSFRTNPTVVMSAISSVTFSVHEGTVPNLAGTVGVTVRNGSEIELRCTYDDVPTTGEIGAHEFHLSADVQPSTPFFRYVHRTPSGQANPEIKAPFLTPLRLVQRDGSNVGGIRLNPILLTDESTYKCQVFLASFQAIASPTVKVNVVAIPHVPTLSMTPGTLVAGMELTVTCSTNVGKPKGQLKWLRQLKTESSPVVIQRNNTVSEVQNSDGSFEVTELYIVDSLPEAYDGAIFTCESRNDALMSGEASPYAELTLDLIHG